jgi:Undecaprenyl-phosphate glucose phosphotransferase
MSDISQRFPGRVTTSGGLQLFHPYLFGPVAFALDFVGIISASLLTGIVYHLAIYGDTGPFYVFLRSGIIVAFFFTLPFLFREKYNLASYITNDTSIPGLFLIWNYAFFSMFTLDFLTKSTDILSRGTLVLFFFTGFGIVAYVRTTLVNQVRLGCKTGRVAARRIMLVGTDAKIRDFQKLYQPWNHGLRINHSIVLDEHFDGSAQEGDSQKLDKTLNDALSLTRQDRLDDVILLLPWSRRSLIEHCVNHFATSSVSIHLGPQAIFERFENARLSKLGSIATLNLVRPPLSRMEIALKRSFDILASLTGLIILSPILALFAIAIKLDSKGPVLFRQTRYGFNLEPFKIIKFRTMTVMENGDDVKQVVKNDPRITHVGQFMRKWNIDELPQLINVLKGDMSLVGPRPHAVTHDHEFAQKIAQYARRMNVQPGITGLAQVNGFRGPTDTDEKILKRVEHDLHYIDKWSFWLDINIIFMTLFSKKAYDNAH